MKEKKILVITISILIVSILSIVTYNLSSDKEVIMSNHISKSKKNNLISVLIETSYGSGEYRESTTSAWPDGYSINKDLSKCQNGSELSYDEENKKVEVAAVKSDRCYIYFDAAPEDDVHIAVANVPNKPYERQANLSCTGGSAIYSNKYQRIEISSLNKNVNCTLNYTDRTSKTYLNSYIIGLAGTTQGTGQVVNEKGYRYQGENPNNYIWFNNELWRIIGVFDSTSHGVASTNLVKIIRNDSVGGLAWSKANTNNWNTATLKTLLNNEYLNSINGTNGDNCYGYSTTSKAKCDYTTGGIKDIYRGMIKEVTWYLGGYSNSSVTAETMYGYERNATSKLSNNPASINAKVGLMYASDYGYAVPAANCARTTNISSYSNANCTLNNWLYRSVLEWTITPFVSYSSHAFNLDGSGSMNGNGALNGFATRPVLYLDSSVYVIDGDGTISNPYIIGI